MERKKPGLDMINELLEECILAYPVSSFIISLYKQYRERGSLSKKQLQGLHAKASIIKSIAPGKLATVEAIINKMPTRDKSGPALQKAKIETEDNSLQLISDILSKYPQHKRVLFLESKYDNKEGLSAGEIGELNRFKQVLK